jgi:hypothetical protein
VRPAHFSPNVSQVSVRDANVAPTGKTPGFIDNLVVANDEIGRDFFWAKAGLFELCRRVPYRGLHLSGTNEERPWTARACPGKEHPAQPGEHFGALIDIAVGVLFSEERLQPAHQACA